MSNLSAHSTADHNLLMYLLSVCAAKGFLACHINAFLVEGPKKWSFDIFLSLYNCTRAIVYKVLAGIASR